MEGLLRERGVSVICQCIAIEIYITVAEVAENSSIKDETVLYNSLK